MTAATTTTTTATTTGYCTDHPPADVSGEPDFTRALEFFQQVGIIRRRTPTQNAAVFTAYPDIEMYLGVEARLREADDKRRRRRDGRGLTSYLSDLLGWKRRWHAAFMEHKERDEMGESGASTVFHSSIKIGRLVDEQLEQLSQCKPVADVHPYAKWFIQYLYTRSWVMCGAQVPLWDDSDTAGVSTRADAIVYDLAQRRFLLLELKTGYDNDYTRLLHEREPGDRFDDSYYWCHQHQLGWMLHKLLPRLISADSNTPPTGVVLRISDAVGVRQPHPMHADVLAYYCNAHAEEMRANYLLERGNSTNPFSAFTFTGGSGDDTRAE